MPVDGSFAVLRDETAAQDVPGRTIGGERHPHGSAFRVVASTGVGPDRLRDRGEAGVACVVVIQQSRPSRLDVERFDRRRGRDTAPLGWLARHGLSDSPAVSVGRQRQRDVHWFTGDDVLGFCTIP